MIAGIVVLCAIAVISLVIKTGFNFTEWGFFAEKSANLALQKGVKATSDSVEVADLSAEKAIDGDDFSFFCCIEMGADQCDRISA